ncbi:MAG: hypothetical protein HN742_27105 [Lentisphaerae bacterium]|jgi:hypothetical protein|nr:hypothetical protein [Lentisphaerota bacterium]MBT5607849.1 hypothetical protein [Lentisphaerota bacterium]MBT7054831.1 hypothetical protein [Lentisphaerota bacterium]MBT7845571.1 hypothetical protein [Lentisphaerota bacterium]
MTQSVSRLCVYACLSVVFAGLCRGQGPDVLLCREFENFGEGPGVSVVPFAEASGGTAGSLAPSAERVTALRLKPGAYTLVMRTWAPAGDQDAFFVTFGSRRIRRTVPIGRWGSVSWPFEAGVSPVFLVIEGQEPGVIIDRLAIVRGTHADESIDLAKSALMRGDTVTVPPETAPRSVRRCVLRQPLPAVRGSWPNAGLAVDFTDTIGTFRGHGSIRTDAAGEFAALEMPDGRFDLDASSVGNGEALTIGWWVKPRPAASVWSDQGWHFFLGVRSQDGARRIELSRHVVLGMRLRIAAGKAEEAIVLATRQLDPLKWHHLLVSWDLRGDRQKLWFLIDGRGKSVRFPAAFAPSRIKTLEFGNSPSGSGLPFLAMDGALDGIWVQDDSAETMVTGLKR